MKFWTEAETIEWLGRVKDLPEHGRDQLKFGTEGRFIKLPNLSDHQAVFSTTFIERLGEFAGCVFWLTEWAVWTDYHNPVLLERFRLSYGEARTLKEAPTFVLDASEREEAIALLRILIMFCYDGEIFLPSGYGVMAFWGHEFAAHTLMPFVEGEDLAE